MISALISRLWPRRLSTGLLSCVFLLAAALSVQAAESVVLLPHNIDVFRPALKAAAAQCSLNNNNRTAMAYLSTIQTGDRFASYLNPADCQGTEDYPMAIYWVSLPIYHFSGAHWPVGVNVQIYTPAGADSCSGPGELLYSHHCLLDSAIFAAPHVGVLTLPDPVCVTGPFYVVVEYDGSTPTPYPSVLFDTQLPADPCLNWLYEGQWYRWDQFWEYPGAGNFMIWVDGYSNSNVCGADEPTVQSVASLYNNWATLADSRVTTVGYFTDSVDSKLVDQYADYLTNRPLPSKSALKLVGPLPDSSFDGSLVEVTGYLMARENPFPYYSGDTMTLSLYPSKWTRLVGSPVYPGAERDTFTPIAPGTGCDSGLYAVLIGGGVNEASDHARYWNEIAKAYELYVYGMMHCPENVSVLYSDGSSRDVSRVPASRVGSYTASQLQNTLSALARKVAQLRRRGYVPQVNVYVGGQGSSEGALTFGGQKLGMSSFRDLLQPLIDSGCGGLTVSFSAAYSGALADSLKALDNKSYTMLQFYSAAGSDLSYSGPNGSAFARAYVDSMITEHAYSESQLLGTQAYLTFLDSLLLAWGQWHDSAAAWLAAHAVGTVSDTIRNKIASDTSLVNAARVHMAAVLADSASRPRLWTRYQVSEYGSWHTFLVPAHGQAVLNFSGDTTVSGNVAVYKDSMVGDHWTDIKSAVWNWNIPASRGFITGNDRRVLNGESGITLFRLHDDSRAFAVTTDLLTDRPGSQSPSNSEDCAGFSLGAIDASADEFSGSGIVAPYAVLNPELPGIRLDTVPSVIDDQQIDFPYNIASQTQWWSSMEVIVVLSGSAPAGQLNLSIEGADSTLGTLSVNGPGRYTFRCGAISGTGTHTLSILPSINTYHLDYLALRSRAAELLSCCLGTTGNVNGVGIVDLSDLSMLVSYLTGGGAILPCYDEANINGKGIVDLTDLSVLVSYLTGGGAALPICP